ATFAITGGSITGTGTITGNVTNGGTVSPGTATAAGALSITGNYTQTASGSLNIKLGGTSAGQFDTLAVTGTATLAGAVNASSLNSFTATSGQRFDVLTYASKSGSYTTATGGVTVDSATSSTTTTLVGTAPNPTPTLVSISPNSVTA